MDLSPRPSWANGHYAVVDFDNAAFLLSVGLTCVSVTMPVKHPALSRESTSVYGLERDL